MLSSNLVLGAVRTGCRAVKQCVLSKRNFYLNYVYPIKRGFYRTAVKMDKTDKPPKEELICRLTPAQYRVTQEKGTEYPYTGEYLETYDPGVYLCVVCKKQLFSSDTKFDSGCGWPAFNDVVDKENVKLNKDTSHGMVRTEVTCSNCEAHLGHVFDDGPLPTGLRYCINSASLHFKPKEDK